MLAFADAGRGSNESREVRAHSKEFAKGPQRGQSPAGCGLQPSDSLGWGLPGCGVGPPILGRQCQETRSRLPCQDGEPIAKASLANVEAALGAAAPVGAASPANKKTRKRKKESPGEGSDKEKKPATKPKVEDRFTNKTHPKKWGGLFHSTPEGRELCYTWAKGATPEACAEPCEANRAHRCQICLGAHQNRECKKEPPKGKGKGNRK